VNANLPLREAGEQLGAVSSGARVLPGVCGSTQRRGRAGSREKIEGTGRREKLKDSQPRRRGVLMPRSFLFRL
jgi:hypothetical protein